LQVERELWLDLVDAEHEKDSKRTWRRRSVKTQPPEKRTLNRDQDSIESLRDAIEAARESQVKYTGKKRLKDGKVQGCFLKLLKTLDGYSNVLSILPSSAYTSVFCGAVRVLVKVRLTITWHPLRLTIAHERVGSLKSRKCH
jgi:hypothetical protein